MVLTALCCPRCQAPIDPSLLRSNLVTCQFCGTPIHVGASLPQTLLAIRPEAPALPGWELLQREGVSWTGDAERQLLVQTAGGLGHPTLVLRSQPTFDDFEAILRFRLLWGDLATSCASLVFRASPLGAYAVSVDTQGRIRFAYLSLGGAPDVPLLPWTAHAAIRAAAGDVNEVRVVARGDRFRVMINGAIAASVREGSSIQGHVGVGCSSSVPMAMGIVGLEILEVPQAASAAPRAAAAVAALDGPVEVMLERANPTRKILAIKVVREVLGIGLKEAKELVEGAPCSLGRFEDRAKADRLKRDLEAAGATVALRHCA